MDPMVSDDELFDITREATRYNTLIGSFSDEVTKVKERRKARENKRNVIEERQRGVILEDETIIPDRTIELNVARGRVPYISYVTQAKRLLVITDLDDPSRPMGELELWYTRGMRFPDWIIPWIKLIDSIHVHGGCSLEVMYSVEAPLKVKFEYIPRHELIIPLKTKNIQALRRILRKFEITQLQLEEFAAAFGFNQTAVDKVKAKFTEREDFINIYRSLFKAKGVVYNAWFCPESNDLWLRDPVQHDIGLYDIDIAAMAGIIGTPMETEYKASLQPLPLREYPIVWFPYNLTEDEEILQIQGRVALDLHVQEALTELLTNTVNATTRASRFYPTAENMPGEDPQWAELGPLKHGVVMNRKVNIWQANWPQNIILSVIQALDIRKAQDSGGTDFAAMARPDANKTKYEMQLASSLAKQQEGVSLGVFSSAFLRSQAVAFSVARQQAMINAAQRPKDPMLLFGNFGLQPAGDIEIVKRMEDLDNAQRFFELIASNPELVEKLIGFLIDHFFPDQAGEWKAVLAQQNQNKDEMILKLAELLSQVPQNELSPEQSAGLQSVVSSAREMVARSNNAGTFQNFATQAGGVAPSGNEMQ